MNRRQFLLTSSAFGSLTLAGCGGGGGSTSASSGSNAAGSAALTAPSGPAVSTGTAASYANGVGAVTAASGSYNLGAGSLPGGLLYNQNWPSAAIRIAPGATLDITLTNGLTENTNVHWHGIVAPAAVDGHPTDVIAPGASKRHTFVVNERPGTYWYHPHPDGLTARQAYLGLAGLLIVDDGQDAVRGLPTGPRDLSFVLGDKRIVAGALNYAPTPMDLVTGWLGNTVLVNGAILPTATLEPAVYRFRLLNGSNARILNPAFADGRSFWLIGTDAGLLDAPIPITSLLLAPGERAELLVDLRTASGSALSFVSAAAAGLSGGMGGGTTGGVTVPPQGAAMELFKVNVTAPLSAAAGSVPTAFTPIVRYSGAAAQANTRVFTLGPAPGAGSGGMNLINGTYYLGTRTDFTVPLGQLELWRFVNQGMMPHPMHMHGAQFQVLTRNGGALETDAGWKDTVLVRSGETVDIALRFSVTGRYVLHCHNLEHEDNGMMLNFVVQ